MSAITQDINGLRKSISDEHKKAIGAAKKSLEHIRSCGELLIELKAKVEHGQFRFELIHLNIKPTTAANYMRVAGKWASVAHLPRVRDALRLLSKGDAPLEMPVASQDPPPEVRTRSTPTPLAASVIIDAEEVGDIKPEDEPETLVVNGINDKLSVKGGSGSTCRTKDEILDDYLMAEIVRVSPEWATVDSDYLSKIKVEDRSGDQTRTVKNLIYELWILAPAVRAEILTGINTLQPIKL